MKRQMLSFVDRLAERGLVDRFGFLCFAFGGALLIVLAKALSVPALIVAVLAAAAIVVYAFMIQRSGTGRLRSDQAGDNCYYLGLIYTLASLAYAIFTFDPADTATTIIQGFGVALATTIIGLVLRVYFNQSRPDLAEAETMARLELAAASGKLKSELSRSIVSMNDFSRQTRQSLEELTGEIVVTLQRVREGAETALGDMSRVATSAVTESSEAAVTRSKKFSTATDKVVTGIENYAASLSGLDQAQVQIGASLAALQSAAERSEILIGHLVTQSSNVGQIQTSASETVHGLSGAASALRDHVATLTAAADRLEAMLVAKIAEVQAIPRSVVDNAITGLEGAIERMREDLQSIVDAQASAAGSITDRVRQATDMTSRHNDALEMELARSRDNVAKVHAALVDMTGRLATDVEARVG